MTRWWEGRPSRLFDKLICFVNRWVLLRYEGRRSGATLTAGCISWKIVSFRVTCLPVLGVLSLRVAVVLKERIVGVTGFCSSGQGGHLFAGSSVK